jgi:TetR/AcrR family transcriptional repressor of bet genes
MDESAAKTAKAPVRRRAAKGVRKRQLIEATIESIAKRGLGETTLAHVSKAAGLSQGIVNLHFTSKENLLNETLNFLREDYDQALQTSLSKAPNTPAERLAALLRADFKASVADIKKVAVWFAFWGEVKSRPAYRKICQERVNNYNEILHGLLEALVEEGHYADIDILQLSETITSLADGLWLNLLISARGMKRREAEKIMMQYLSSIFPKHVKAFQ